MESDLWVLEPTYLAQLTTHGKVEPYIIDKVAYIGAQIFFIMTPAGLTLNQAGASGFQVDPTFRLP